MAVRKPLHLCEVSSHTKGRGWRTCNARPYKTHTFCPAPFVEKTRKLRLDAEVLRGYALYVTASALPRITDGQRPPIQPHPLVGAYHCSSASLIFNSFAPVAQIRIRHIDLSAAADAPPQRRQRLEIHQTPGGDPPHRTAKCPVYRTEKCIFY